MINKTIKETINNSIKVKADLLANDSLLKQIEDLANKCEQSLRANGKIIFCGNGGSFADAQHLSAEFTSRFLFNRPALASIALGTNSSATTAIGNDYGFDNIFSRELEALGHSSDVIIAITTSGNSLNILEVLKVAQKKNIYVAVLTGSKMGMIPLGTNTLNVPSIDTARIQECHIMIGHIICGLVEEAIYGDLKV